MDNNAKIYVAGHMGMLGSAIVRNLRLQGFTNIIGRSIDELDLTDKASVDNFFSVQKPEYVFLAAAKVAGIGAMSASPVEYMQDNLHIQNNVFNSAHNNNVKKLIFISSAAAYPVDAEQPINESALMTGVSELENEGYSIAKIAGIKLCSFYKKQYGDAFISVIPSNIYGYNGIFDIKRSHVIPAMIRRFHSAKVHGLESVTIWGTGKARRELLFADDAADGCIFLMKNKTDDDYYNLGCNIDHSMLEIANIVKKVVGYSGKILTDPSKPEGVARRLLNSTKTNMLGWNSKTSLEEGLALTYQWFLENIEDKDEFFI